MHVFGLVPRLGLLRLRYGWQSPGAQQLGDSSMACQLAIVFITHNQKWVHRSQKPMKLVGAAAGLRTWWLRLQYVVPLEQPAGLFWLRTHVVRCVQMTFWNSQLRPHGDKV